MTTRNIGSNFAIICNSAPQDFRKECIQRSERRDRRIHSVFRRIHSVIFEQTALFHRVLWVFAEYTRIFAEYTCFLGVLRRIHSNAKGVYSAAEYTRISPDTLESRRIHSNLAEYTRFRRIHSLAEYTRIQKLANTYDLELANLVFLCLCTLS